ncbi:hypothetical protein Tco_0519595 [Tanacetum coccineum]
MARIMTITRSGMTPEAIEELISRRVDEALATQEANRNARLIDENQSQNGDDNDNGSGGNGNHGNNNGNGNRKENGFPEENERLRGSSRVYQITFKGIGVNIIAPADALQEHRVISNDVQLVIVIGYTNGESSPNRSIHNIRAYYGE